MLLYLGSYFSSTNSRAANDDILVGERRSIATHDTFDTRENGWVNPKHPAVHKSGASIGNLLHSVFAENNQFEGKSLEFAIFVSTVNYRLIVAV